MRRTAIGLLSLVAAAACGSTVPMTSSQQGVAVTSLGPGSAMTGLGGEPGPGATGPATPLVPGSHGGAGQSGTATGAVTGSAPPVVSGRIAPTVPGVTATTVKLGVEYINSAALGAFAAAAGGGSNSGVGAIDARKAFQAAADAVNKAGGVAGGRKLVIVAHERKLTDDNATADQKACAAFTEDDHVLAALASTALSSSLVPCLAKHNVLSLGTGGVAAGVQRDFASFGGRYIAPGTVESVTGARAYVDALVRQGFLTPRSTVGLLWFDLADYRTAIAQGLKPALQRHGITLKTDYRVTYNGSSTDLAPIASAMQNAALRFRSEGVDRVISQDYNGAAEFFFMQAADKQGYRPQYGLNTASDPEFLRANAPARQLAGARGIGWGSGYDVMSSRQPTDPQRRRCLAAMRASGLNPTAQTDVLLVDQACGTVFTLVELLRLAPDLTPAGLAAGAARLARQPSYTGFSDSYSANKYWGAATYRDLVYDTDCTCLAYSGPVRPF